MAELKTLSIATDINGGALNESKLDSEIAASGLVSGYSGIVCDGDNFKVLGDSIPDDLALRNLIHGHTSVTLADYKTARNKVIDARTKDIVLDGYVFDGDGTTEKQVHLDAGQALKTSVDAAVDVATIDAIVDSR